MKGMTMANKYPTTCTACRAPFDAGFFVVSDQEIRLCPACEERAQRDRELVELEDRLVFAEGTIIGLKLSIAAHKALHPPLVVTGQGTSRKEYG